LDAAEDEAGGGAGGATGDTTANFAGAIAGDENGDGDDPSCPLRSIRLRAEIAGPTCEAVIGCCV
jgi:hypothetical protein